jgi:2-amino-4-hydroxy-6-hydroxymethyldihydropteridine diphosphokinase
MSSQLSTTNKSNLKVYISLGSNQESASGTALETLKLALVDLQAMSIAPLVKSSFYQTQPVDCAPGTAEFINSAAKLELPVDCDPVDLLQSLHGIEAKFGRDRDGNSNAPRPLDLDLIYISAIQLDTSELVLPHPRAHERLFVLLPLAEIEPDLELLPGQPSVTELISGLPDGPWVRKL